MGLINNTFSSDGQSSNNTIVSLIPILPAQGTDCCPPNSIAIDTNGGNVPKQRRIDTQLPLFGGGDMLQDRTHGINVATDSQDGYLSKEDHRLLGANTAYKIISGYCVWTGVGLTFRVSTCVYRINGVLYTTQPYTFTLAPNPNFDRIDTVYLTTSQSVGVYIGTPQTNPVKPAVFFATQIELTFIYIKGGATTPTNPSVETLVYDENVEWITSGGNNSVDYNNITTPYRGTKSAMYKIENSSGRYQATTVIKKELTEFLVFYVRLVSPDLINSTPIFTVSIITYNGVTSTRSNAYIIGVQNGFRYDMYNVYQEVIIKVSDISGAINGNIQELLINAFMPTQFNVDAISFISLPTQQNNNSASKMYHVVSASFYDATNYNHIDMIGKNLAIFHQGINRYLESNEWTATSTGFRILLADFNAIRDIYSLFVTTNLTEA